MYICVTWMNDGWMPDGFCMDVGDIGKLNHLWRTFPSQSLGHFPRNLCMGSRTAAKSAKRGQPLAMDDPLTIPIFDTLEDTDQNLWSVKDDKTQNL